MASSDGMVVKCTLCFDAKKRWPHIDWPARAPQEWIGVGTRPVHRKSAFHKRALQAWEEAQVNSAARQAPPQQEEPASPRNLDDTVAVKDLFHDVEDMDMDMEQETRATMSGDDELYDMDDDNAVANDVNNTEYASMLNSETGASVSDIDDEHSEPDFDLTSEERLARIQAEWKARKSILEKGDYYPYDGLVTFLLDVVDTFARQNCLTIS